MEGANLGRGNAKVVPQFVSQQLLEGEDCCAITSYGNAGGLRGCDHSRRQWTEVSLDRDGRERNVAATDS